MDSTWPWNEEFTRKSNLCHRKWRMRVIRVQNQILATLALLFASTLYYESYALAVSTGIVLTCLILDINCVQPETGLYYKSGGLILNAILINLIFFIFRHLGRRLTPEDSSRRKSSGSCVFVELDLLWFLSLLQLLQKLAASIVQSYIETLIFRAQIRVQCFRNWLNEKSQRMGDKKSKGEGGQIFD